MVMQEEKQQLQQHFLLVSFPVQSHINPVLQLAKRLTSAGVRVTFSTAISAHKRMFPDKPITFPFDDPDDQLLTYYPYSDGYDGGFDNNKDDSDEYMSRIKEVGSKTLYSLATPPDRPAVTCIVYAILLSWAVDVARDLAVPCFLLWIQPAAVYAIYYHYFHGYRSLIDSHKNEPDFFVELPCLPPFRIKDLPSFLAQSKTGGTFESILESFEEMFAITDKEIEVKKGITKPRILVNSFASLEHEALAAVEQLDLVPIGPLLPPACMDEYSEEKSTANIGVVDLIKTTEGKGYMKWPDQWPEKSVVYLSFGSLSVLGKKQWEEFSTALAECGRPYLWVVRGNSREGVEVDEKCGKGKVVGWCSQVEVLSHRSVGCFVTHCGWNSTLESLACGVPMVGLPQWTDQPANARLMEVFWEVGVKADVNEEGVMEGRELRRCLDLVMGEEEKGVEIRRRAKMWKDLAVEAVKDGGSSDLNLTAFVKEVEFTHCY